MRARAAPDTGIDPPTIVIAFDIGEQVAARGIAIRVLAVVNELGSIHSAIGYITPNRQRQNPHNPVSASPAEGIWASGPT